MNEDLAIRDRRIRDAIDQARNGLTMWTMGTMVAESDDVLTRYGQHIHDCLEELGAQDLARAVVLLLTDGNVHVSLATASLDRYRNLLADAVEPVRRRCQVCGGPSGNADECADCVIDEETRAKRRQDR